jgi:hypothetical protein
MIRNSEDVVVGRVGRELYEKFFKNYTRKQWGLDPSELDSSVIARVPVCTNRDQRYVGDTYQAMPLHGFTRMFENMLDHRNIKILLNIDYREIQEEIPYREMIYTGPIDEFFDYRFGKLTYRSLEFKHETKEVEAYQDAPVVNYPNTHALYARYRIQVSDRPKAPEDQHRIRVSPDPKAIPTILCRGLRTRSCMRSTRNLRTPSPRCTSWEDSLPTSITIWTKSRRKLSARMPKSAAITTTGSSCRSHWIARL